MIFENILISLAAYIIGLSIFYGILIEMYDRELLGSMKLWVVYTLIFIWPITMIAGIIFLVFNILVIIGKWIGQVLLNTLDWLKD
jgi:hypothetical protein